MWEDVFYSVDDISYLMELMGKDGEIKHFPKLSEEDSKKYQLEFMKRYRFLYENSFFIFPSSLYAVYILFSLLSKIPSIMLRSER